MISHLQAISILKSNLIKIDQLLVNLNNTDWPSVKTDSFENDLVQNGPLRSIHESVIYLKSAKASIQRGIERLKTKLKQPDLHHEGPLTEEFVRELSDKILTAIQELRPIEHDEPEWAKCKELWLQQLNYAGIRCAAILTKLQFGMEDHHQDEDQKCIDITLCVLRDFEEAKSNYFLRKSQIDLDALN